MAIKPRRSCLEINQLARYTPILRWKRGERVGVQKLTSAGKTGVTPLFLIAPDQFKQKTATGSKPARSAAEAFADEIKTAWGSTPFYLDASALAPSAAHPNPLIDIANAARIIGLNLIPATRLTATAAYQADVVAVATADARGVALRVDMQGLTSAASWSTAWPHALSDTDLIADFADQIGFVAALGAAVNTAFSSLHSATLWRSISVAGSSIPANLTGYTAGLHPIVRSEWSLWQQLNAASLPYQIHFGDYATIPLAAPPAGIAWGFPISVRYTLPGHFLICRGVGTTGFGGVDMDVQLSGHATSITMYPQRNALSHCWGDQRIDAIAAGGSPGNLETWVQISTNRHIEITRNRLP